MYSDVKAQIQRVRGAGKEKKEGLTEVGSRRGRERWRDRRVEESGVCSREMGSQ